ncbi:uncharacterized protein LOC130625191 [Hydractinia symbiolongicarpus]|uniref:uncharacterized protein LOC130625191 n=1 Tax=Hydractinia symbiolongicarpus TaxID=13093 RepID=UPI00254A3450|nr:uncharacterized protein LOC130625191 [Hydractinia symbiolongicarpus]
MSMPERQSNAPKLAALVNERYKGPLEVNHEGNTTKVLGLQWLKDSEKIGFNFEEIKPKFHAKPDTTDASKAAYGCCVYIRFEKESGKIKTDLVPSKSRVAPTKSQTIPRLELLGALMLARLLDTVSRVLNNAYPIEHIFAWIDSSVVYSWIKNSDKIYKPFIQNRLTEIRLLYVNCLKLDGTNDNPADISSRGSSPLKLPTGSLWFEGPGFLTLPEYEWPRLQVGDKFLPESSCEEKILLNVKSELTCLKSDSDCKVQNNKNFEVEKVKLLRCKGRVQNSPLPYDTRHPVFLPTQCELLPLVSDLHRAVGHNRPRDTLCHVRKQFWIPRLRQVVRNLLRNCTLCKRYESKAFTYPSTSALPDFRLSLNFDFTKIGIDYATWICLVTCASGRAVYLDISTYLSASACVNVLKRFENKNGAPKVINSDNGSNFISKEVQHFAYHMALSGVLILKLRPGRVDISKVDYEEMLTILSAIERILNNRPLTAKWKIGRVTELLKSKDARIRKVLVATNNNRKTLITRILNKFYPVKQSDYENDKEDNDEIKIDFINEDDIIVFGGECSLFMYF